VAEVLGEVNREEAISELRRYKNERSRENFNRVMRVCLSLRS
jgi:hypothetical protein